MKQSQMFIPTLKENPADAEARSHQLMLRAGYIRQTSAGIYSYLPLAVRVLQKIEAIIRDAINETGAVEVSLPEIIPADLWRESGRYATYGENLFKLKDRHQRDFVLGPTHEETITDLVRHEIRSYKKLPLTLYQIKTKFRDEDRPRYGLLRGREFIMYDAYSFSANPAQLDDIFDKQEQAYRTIFDQVGLNYRMIIGDAGAMGGNDSREFSAIAEIGEDTIAYSDNNAYAANLEMAKNQDDYIPVQEQAAELTKVATPNVGSIEDVANFLSVVPQKLIKSVLFMADGEPVLALIRGDYEINNVKLKNFLQADALTLASEAEVQEWLQAPVGSVGPVKINDKIRLVADETVMNLTNAVTGANEAEHHFLNVNPGRDFEVAADQVTDLRVVREGDLALDGKSRLHFTRGIEIGHIFKLGTRYTKTFQATFLDENGREQPLLMGCYGIGVSRLLSAIIEQHSDDHGIIWPRNVAPFDVHLIPVNIKKQEQLDVTAELEKVLHDAGYTYLTDDRNERAGVKFADSDLIGLPLRITVGKKAADGIVEVQLRATGEKLEVKKEDLVNVIQILLAKTEA
ncbi:proline--tRNA ligase [Lapidilactobacillus gannanensis]|uniref:Proline--tRNA ligase n=1 Tax=Lapidilactobacillus gannanensis TaxID=2486002 RepID=A0ABW4BNF5_9LACO|nr:proline--tRNA ligase [Lapidilactobacillus gannanensis]